MASLFRLPSRAPRLSMRGVSMRFGATVALAGVDLDVGAGSVHALVGENGAGKSTLMKIISGAHRPDAGHMQLDGQPYAPRNPWDARQAGVAMIYQELSLAPHLTVLENMMLGIEPSRGPLLAFRQMRLRAKQALRELGCPSLPLDAPVRRLPTAQRQLVEIARAVATDCRVLILDEPTSSLQRDDIAHLFDLVRRLKQRGHAVLYISHFLEEVQEISDTFTVLRDGKTVGGGATATARIDQMIALMVGREVNELYPRSPRQARELVLEIVNLAGAEKPRSASLKLHRGEVVGIAGLIGAGRTELLRTVFGLDKVVSGQVKLAAFHGTATPSQRWMQGLGIVSEDRKQEGLAGSLSLADNLTLSKLEGTGPWRLVTPAGQDRASRRWIDQLAIKCHSPRQAVHTLSGGNQQKVAMARLLHHDVDVLLLDEPTRGIDVGSKAQIYRLIDQLVADRGQRPPRAVLMVSSYLPELLAVCDRIAVMCRGVLSEARPTSEWDEQQLMTMATGQERAT